MKRKRLKVLTVAAFVMMGINLNQTALATENEATQVSETASTESTTVSSRTESTSTTESSTTISPKVKAERSVPKIMGAENRTIALNEKFDSKTGVTAQDANDGVLTDKVKVSGTVDSSKAGKYALTYSVENSQGEKAEKTVTVTVKAPVTKANSYQVELADFSLPLNSKLSDEIQKRLVIKDKDNKVVQLSGVKVTVEGNERASKEGASSVNFTVNLPDGTIVKKVVTITVYSGIRIVEPKEGYKHTGSIYEDAIDFMNYIEAYEIDSEGKEKSLTAYDENTGVGIKVLKTDIDISTPGKYSIVYKVTNSLGEIKEHTSYVTVEKRPEAVTPTLQVTDQVMYVGDVLTKEIVLGWAKTTNTDQLSFEVIEDQILINSLTNRLEKAGVYKIRFTASRIDEATQAELTVQKTITLTVKEKETTPTKETYTNTGTVAKRAVPTSSVGAKSLPKTGTEKADARLMISGIILVGLTCFAAVNRKRVAK
ncbi:immunoglobulin-like domain-containing protein [Enterococcus sp. DIV0170]|uniref:immunoglobulin-like domain-containing protein n=1 Tax=Enterococcus sp. DIV0170 TaxID=2774642 RepID=UPI003F6871B9